MRLRFLRLFHALDNSVRLVSSLGNDPAPLDHLVDHPSFRFVLQTIRQQIEHIPVGFELKIDSEFSADIGFGSSAAITTATHAALMYWIRGEPPKPETLFSESLETVQAVQGRRLGADLASSVFGGVVGYSTEPEFHSLGTSACVLFCC